MNEKFNMSIKNFDCSVLYSEKPYIRNMKIHLSFLAFGEIRNSLFQCTIVCFRIEIIPLEDNHKKFHLTDAGKIIFWMDIHPVP